MRSERQIWRRIRELKDEKEGMCSQAKNKRNGMIRELRWVLDED